jgi:1,2-diacylglycerol 3-alpha-glucosyltransferase
MKIAYFTDSYYPQLNGVVTSVENFTKVYRSQGHTVYIIGPKIRGYKDNDPDIIRITTVRAWPTLPDLLRIPLPPPGGYFRKLMSLEVDIVHAHGNGPITLIGLVFAKLKKAPFAHTFHNLHAIHAGYILKGKIITPGMVKGLLKQLADWCDLIIAPSYKMESELLSYGVNKKIEVVPNFLHIEKFDGYKNSYLHKKLGIPSSIPLLLAVGRLEPEKNFEFLIKTFSLVCKTDKTSRLVIVGDGRLKEKLQSLAEKLKVADRFHLTGNIPSSEMPKVYKSAYMFVFASYTEVHPMVTLEAAASELPVIVVDDKAYEGAVSDNVNGYVVKPSTKDFAKKIIELLKSPKKAEEFGKKSKKQILDNFGSDYATTKLMDLYKKTISEFRRVH